MTCQWVEEACPVVMQSMSNGARVVFRHLVIQKAKSVNPDNRRILTKQFAELAEIG